VAVVTLGESRPSQTRRRRARDRWSPDGLGPGALRRRWFATARQATRSWSG